MIKKKYKRKSSSRKIFVSLTLGSLLFIIIVFLIISNWRINERRDGLIQRISQLRQEIQVLEERNQQLKAGVSQTLQSDYAEEVLREKGLYKKKGEEMVVILSPEAEEEGKKEEERSIWEKILGKLKLRD